jgi:hypothetical protein
MSETMGSSYFVHIWIIFKSMFGCVKWCTTPQLSCISLTVN